jgi:hypothetical protein
MKQTTKVANKLKQQMLQQQKKANKSNKEITKVQYDNIVNDKLIDGTPVAMLDSDLFNQYMNVTINYKVYTKARAYKQICLDYLSKGELFTSLYYEGEDND